MLADLPYNDYFEYFGPDYTLDVQSSNMENLNTREYLEKTRAKLIDNLRHMPHCPSTPFQGTCHRLAVSVLVPSRPCAVLSYLVVCKFLCRHVSC